MKTCEQIEGETTHRQHAVFSSVVSFICCGKSVEWAVKCVLITTKCEVKILTYMQRKKQYFLNRLFFFFLNLLTFKIACALLLRVKTVWVLRLKYRRPQRSPTWHSSSSAFPRKYMFTQWFSPLQDTFTSHSPPCFPEWLFQVCLSWQSLVQHCNILSILSPFILALLNL